MDIYMFPVYNGRKLLERTEDMTIHEYQQLAMTTLNPELSEKDVLINGVMGLCGESGEAIDIVKKWLAQGHELDKEKLAKGTSAGIWQKPQQPLAFRWRISWLPTSKSSAADIRKASIPKNL